MRGSEVVPAAGHAAAAWGAPVPGASAAPPAAPG